MTEDFNRKSSETNGDKKEMKGKIVISKLAAVVVAVVILLIILAVGLLAGLVGRRTAPEHDVSDHSTASEPGVITSTTHATTTPQKTGPWSDIRLPTTLIPHHYMVDLQPNLTPDASGMYWFTGKSEAFFNVKESTDYIYIHANKLEFTTVNIKDNNGDQVDRKDWWWHKENEYLIIPLDSPLTVGMNYSLYTEFKGELVDGLAGLYRISYTNADGNRTVIAVTQMEPTDARKTFPCFDEPALKATFDIYLSHQDPYYALSNMPNISTEVLSNGWKRTKFERTPIMSTYLLAFVIVDFGYVESTTTRGIQTRIYAREAQVEKGNANYAKRITPAILDHYEEYFGVPYPLPKSDQIAVPDFAAGAMENWGLVIYRETALLYEPGVSSASNKQRVAVVVAHELAHQWFGNLISPLWWDELWLNEGFASYVEYLGADFVEPTWRMQDQFVVIDLQQALSEDGLVSSRPIVAENVRTPDDINALFDTISYSKGACIIRMINRFTGEAAFKLGLKNYLNAYKYGPVEHNQLFTFWEKAMEAEGAELPPNGFIASMNSWIHQMGYPTISMKRKPGTTSIEISQERFLLDPAADKSLPESTFGYQWTVPLWHRAQNDANVSQTWIEPGKAATTEVPANKYFLGNDGAYGYYRVNYDDENWRRIITQLNNDYTDISITTKAQLLNDAFSLARSGEVSYDIILGLTEFLREDFHYIPWESALDQLQYFDTVLGRSKAYGVYSAYMAYTVQPLYNRLTWTNDGNHLEQYQQINAIEAACFYGVPGCVENATNQFNGWMADPSNNRISVNLRTTVYCNAIANGGAKEWDFAWDQYLNESNSQEKSKLQYGLTCTRTPWIITRLLDKLLNGTYVRKQDASRAIEDLCHNEHARDITWDWVQTKWDSLYDIYGKSFFSFSGIISSCTSHFSTEFELAELESFKQTNQDKLGSGATTTEQAIELTKTNINWRSNYEDIVYEWFKNKVSTI